MIIIEDLNVTDIVVPIAEDVSYIVDSAGTAVTDVRITMKEHIVAVDDVEGVTLVFDNTLDTITRDKGSWLDGRFAVGMNVTITGSTSNNLTSIIVTVTDKVITITSTEILADETTTVDQATVVGAIPDTDWFVYETATAGTVVFNSIEFSPTGLRFVKTGGAGTVRVWVRS